MTFQPHQGPQLPPPGWYSDHREPQVQRWWDGSQWTTHTRPLPAVPQFPPSALQAEAPRTRIHPMPAQPVPVREAPRKRKRVFLWVFLAIQVLFVIWIIVGVATVHTAPTQAQLAQGCYDGRWYPLFKSQADCVQHYGGALNDAGTAGKAIGVGLIVVFWMIVDVILGVSYGVYRLATRSRNG